MLMYVSSPQVLTNEIFQDGQIPADSCRGEVFTRLSQRIAAETPDLLPALNRLKDGMTDTDYTKYIESLVRVRQKGDFLLVITDKEMHRSIIEKRFKSLMAKCFGANIVRVISQAQ